LREQRRAKIENNQKLLETAENWKSKEFYLMGKSDLTFVFSNSEKEIIEKENQRINVAVLPWIQRINNPLKDFKEKRDLIFIGGFVHMPNEDAVFWFAREIFPLIKSQLPEIKFVVMGSYPTEKILRLNSDDIVITGFVKDVSTHFNDAKIFVCPLRYGAGFKGKIVQAMSYGLPVVTTSIGAEGMDLKNGENVLIADNPEEFARKVVEIYLNEDLWKKLSHNSIVHVRENYVPGVVKKKIKERLQGINIMTQDRDNAIYAGLCTVCGEQTFFTKSGENLRETFICKNCGSNSRNRHLAKVLCKAVGGKNISSLTELVTHYPYLKIYEAQASGSINSILKGLDGYICSEFFSDVKPGSSEKGTRCEDLQNLSFTEKSFDMVISQDVFEHVRDPWLAFKEVYRVLRPSGYHIFTIPYYKDSKSIRRVQIEGDKDIYILPKVFHGDGVRDGLVYTNFGYDLLEYLDSVGFSTEIVWSNNQDLDENQIHCNVVFVSKKVEG
ncbi:MAG: glycosyltransferase, partial [Nitrospirota bacterium]